MAKVLFVGIAPPTPTTSGQRMRTRCLLEAIKQEGHALSLISFADPADLQHPQTELAGLCDDWQLVPSPSGGMAGGEYLRRILGIFSSEPYGARRVRSAPMRDAIQAALSKQKFDFVICPDIYMLASLPENLDIPVLMNKDDLTFVIVKQFADSDPNPLKRLYAEIEYKKIFKLETEACANSAAVLVCSKADEDGLLRHCPTARTFVVPNVIDVDRYQSSAGDDKRTVIFVGAMDWLPNKDGVTYFAEQILPLLRRRVPNARFLVAGRNPSEEFKAKFAGIPEMEFTGTLPDMRTAIASAAVCVVPLRIGSGTRLKILEAAAMGKAIVSTTLGAEGLEFQDGVEIALADDPERFAAAVADLLNDQNRRSAMGAAARRVVEERYSMKVLRESIRTAFNWVSERSRKPN